MFRNASTLEGSTVTGTDGEIGHVEDVYFDDETWAIRYLVVNTGNWLSSRKVLISPHSVTQPLGSSRTIDVSLTRERVKSSPPLDTHRPVSRQHEREYLGYYGYRTYWDDAPGPLATSPMMPLAVPPDYTQRHETREAESKPEDAHLRSIEHVSGYHVQASDEGIGHVDGFVFECESWAIRYLIVDTRNWWPGGSKVLVATQWIERIDWNEHKVHTTLTRKAVQASPEYQEAVELDRPYETRLHAAYGLDGYWI
jgi:sporulation protein YlmC with PRC-barrel domain